MHDRCGCLADLPEDGPGSPFVNDDDCQYPALVEAVRDYLKMLLDEPGRELTPEWVQWIEENDAEMKFDELAEMVGIVHEDVLCSCKGDGHENSSRCCRDP